MFVEIRIKKDEDGYVGKVLYSGREISKDTLGFANLLERKLTSNKVILKHGIYKNHYTDRETAPSSTHDMVYIDSIKADGKEALLDDIYRLSRGTDNLDIKVPLIIRVGREKYTYDGNNVIQFVEIEKTVVKKLILEK